MHFSFTLKSCRFSTRKIFTQNYAQTRSANRSIIWQWLAIFTHILKFFAHHSAPDFCKIQLIVGLLDSSHLFPFSPWKLTLSREYDTGPFRAGWKASRSSVSRWNKWNPEIPLQSTQIYHRIQSPLTWFFYSFQQNNTPWTKLIDDTRTIYCYSTPGWWRCRGSQERRWHEQGRPAPLLEIRSTWRSEVVRKLKSLKNTCHITPSLLFYLLAKPHSHSSFSFCSSDKPGGTPPTGIDARCRAA